MPCQDPRFRLIDLHVERIKLVDQCPKRIVGGLWQCLFNLVVCLHDSLDPGRPFSRDDSEPCEVTAKGAN
jgi:hypothetical protein